LIQRVTHSATPDQILAAYSDFWQKAAEDYRKEFAAVTKLLTKMSRKAAAVSQTATGETSANAFLSQNAA
jgi:Skp family chaperone for outer membrane proteins